MNTMIEIASWPVELSCPLDDVLLTFISTLSENRIEQMRITDTAVFDSCHACYTLNCIPKECAERIKDELLKQKYRYMHEAFVFPEEDEMDDIMLTDIGRIYKNFHADLCVDFAARDMPSKVCDVIMCPAHKEVFYEKKPVFYTKSGAELSPEDESALMAYYTSHEHTY